MSSSMESVELQKPVKNGDAQPVKAVPEDEEPHAASPLFSILLMISNIFWTGMHWGFISFSAVILNEEEGLSFTKIGSFVPVFGAMYILFTFIVGLIADRTSHKMLLMLGNAFIAGGHALFLTGVYGLMVTGFALIGVGYSAWTIVPYVQIKQYAGRDVKLYDRLYIGVELFFIFSFSFGRLMMMLTTTYASGDQRWQLPWMISFCMLSLHLLLIFFLGKYPMPEWTKTRKEAQEEVMSYKEKVKALYLNPVAFMLLMGSVFNGFTTYAIAAWAPTVAIERFKDEQTEAEINITISLAVLAAWPLGMVIVIAALGKAKRIKSAIRISLVFVLVAAVMLVVYANESDKFRVHIVGLVLFASAGNFPSVLYKQLPEILGLPEHVKTFALSRFTLLYSIFGDIAGWQVTGILIDEIGVNDALWIIVLASFLAVLCWLIPTVWSFQDHGVIHERELEQISEDRALKNWALLKSIATRKARVARTIANTLFFSLGAGALLSRLVYKTDTELVDKKPANQDKSEE